MKILISPAKNFNNIRNDILTFTLPKHLNKTYQLLDKLKNCNIVDFEKNLKLNSELALKALYDYQNFDFDNAATPAILAYKGLVYKYLNSENFNKEELLFCNEHVFIFSAFYGPLRSFDLILPYRMEFNLKIIGNLYTFWKDTYYNDIFSDNQDVLSLLSNEYQKTLTPFLKNDDKIYTVDFLTKKQGKYKIITTNAKMARGSMVNFIVKNKINQINDIKSFDLLGFEFCEDMSSNFNFVFIKKD